MKRRQLIETAIALLLVAPAALPKAAAKEVKEVEPPKGQAGTNVMSLGDTFVGHLQDNSDVDDVDVTCAKPVVVTISLDVPVKTGAWVWAPGVLESHHYRREADEPIRLSCYRLPKGRTRFRVQSGNAGEGVDYRLTIIEETDLAGKDIEDNDKAARALPLTEGRPVRGICSRPRSDVDHYALRIQRRGIRKLTFKRSPREGSKLQGYVIIQPPTGRELYRYYFHDFVNEFHFYPVLDPGDYRVSVTLNYSKGQDAYELAVLPYGTKLTPEELAAAKAGVDKAVAWLAEGTPAQSQARGVGHLLAAEALVMAALSEGGGYTSRSKLIETQYVDWIAKKFEKSRDGTWNGKPVSAPSRAIYEAAVATLCLAEAAHAGSAAAGKLARQSAEYLLAAQQTQRKCVPWKGPVAAGMRPHGGWRYNGESTDADLSVTGWCWVALSAVDAAGIELPVVRDALGWGVDFSKRCGETDGFHYFPGARSTTLLNSVGSFMLLLHGEQGHKLTAGLKHLDPYLPAGTQVDPEGQYAFYYWYYGTRVNYLRGGYPWQAWRSIMIRQLLHHQQADGRWRAFKGEKGIGDRFTTALGAMILRICLNDVPAYLANEVKGF